MTGWGFVVEEGSGGFVCEEGYPGDRDVYSGIWRSHERCPTDYGSCW